METTEKMEITEPTAIIDSVNKEKNNDTSNDLKYKLLEKLNDKGQSSSKSLALAITIQTMFSQNLQVLEKLFQFHIEHNQLEMAIDLWENDLLKNYNLSESNYFDLHFKKISIQIIYHLSVKYLSTKPSNKSNLDEIKNDEFYLQLFLKLSQPSQEKLICQLLDKYRSNFNFLKVNPPSSTAEKPTQQNISFDIKEFYSKLAQNKESILLTKDLLSVYRKFIPEYGLFLIDGFLNVEKQLYTNLILNTSTNLNPNQIDSAANSLERRSLNVIRRICVVDLIPDFIYLIEKLDNRHCYRWIEKSLEFFTKYTLNSIEIVWIKKEQEEEENKSSMMNNTVKLTYSSINLLNDLDFCCNGDTEQERIQENFIKENLKEFIEYKFEQPTESKSENSPFLNVYKLLDEIGKKLDWPSIPNSIQNLFTHIEDKMSFLLNLKSKCDKQTNTVSVSSLNKQISFFGIGLFFNKLIEFHAAAKVFFMDMLVFVKKIKLNVYATSANQTNTLEKTNTREFNNPVEFVVCSLIYCLKLWHKFNQHKEFMTIVTKCLSNSKLDSLNCYKKFLNDYYNVYSSSLNIGSNSATNQVTWDTLNSLNLKQRVSNVVNLFINEKASFQKFFSELLFIIDKVKLDNYGNQNNELEYSYGQLNLSNCSFDLFELNYANTLRYFSKLIIEKLFQLLEQKKSTLKLLSENDELLGHILVLSQINLSNYTNNLIIEFYDVIFQSIKSKGSFTYVQFFDYIYDIQILQDFASLLNSSSSSSSNFSLKLIESENNFETLMSKFINQINLNPSFNKYESLHEFYIKNSEHLAESLNKLFKITN